MEETPVYQILGASFVCSDGVIKELCEISKFVCSPKDVKVFGLRPELRDRFCNVVINTVVDAPPVLLLWWCEHVTVHVHQIL